jgi:hypothetical protein
MRKEKSGKRRGFIDQLSGEGGRERGEVLHVRNISGFAEDDATFVLVGVVLDREGDEAFDSHSSLMIHDHGVLSGQSPGTHVFDRGRLWIDSQ